jgi:Tfp pilus assembly protein PilV
LDKQVGQTSWTNKLDKQFGGHRMSNFTLSKKCIGPVVAIALLMVVSVSSVVMFQKWFQSYQSHLETQIDSFNSNSVDLSYLEPRSLYIRNSGLNSSFSDIKIGNSLCNISGILRANSINKIDLGNCLLGEEIGPKEVILYSNSSIVSKTLMLRSKLLVASNLTASFQNGGCGIGYTELFSLESLSDSHVELANESLYTYSSCIKSENVNLVSSCSGTYTRLFYLDNRTNAHAYSDNSSSYVSTWYEACLSVDSGSISSQISATQPSGDDVVCVGSLEDMDNETGVHMGDCSAYSNKLWVILN